MAGGQAGVTPLETGAGDGSGMYALEAGAESLRAPNDEFYGRMGKVRDPFGHSWSFSGPKKSG